MIGRDADFRVPQPPIDSGFYYEMALPGGAAVQESDWKPLETIVGKISKEKQKFERLTLKKEDLLEMFKYNKYKVGGINSNLTQPREFTYRKYAATHHQRQDSRWNLHHSIP
jgi:threonyl-tRNA synthetase